MYEGFVHGIGVGYKGKVEMARAFTLVWSGKGIATFTATGDRPIQKNEPTLFEIWVCADGYWTDLTKNACPGELKPEYHKLLDLLLNVFNGAVSFARDGASFPELDKFVRARIAEGGYPGQPSHPICHGVGARAHESPYAHQAGGGTIKKGMVLAIEPGIYWPGGGGLRLEDNFLITETGNEKMCTDPDDFRLAETSLKLRRELERVIMSSATTNSKQALDPKLVERILAEVREDEIVCHVQRRDQYPQPHRRRTADGAVHAIRAAEDRPRRHLARSRRSARQRGRPLERHGRRQEPDVQRPHGYVQHRPRGISDRHRLQAERRRQRTVSSTASASTT